MEFHDSLIYMEGMILSNASSLVLGVHLFSEMS